METVKFDELNLQPQILKGIREMGFEETTPIQCKAFPMVMVGLYFFGRHRPGLARQPPLASPF